MADEQVLSLDEFAALDTAPEPPMAQKQVLSMDEFEQLGSAEEAIKSGVPNERFSQEQNLHKVMSKVSPSFHENMAESFKRGDADSNLDMMGYGLITGEMEYDEIRPIEDEYNKRVAENPIDGGNHFTNALYTIAGMIPAMGKGVVEGKERGMQMAIGAAVIPGAQPFVPEAFVFGETMGSLEYWGKQGAGNLMRELKREDVPDAIAKPVSLMAGGFYAAIEKSQIDKLIPGSKFLTKKILVKSSKRLVAELIRRHGVNWAENVGQEGFQDALMSVAKDTATNLAGKTSKSVSDIAEKAMSKAVNTIKASALPMLLLGAPAAAVDTSRSVKEYQKEQKAITAAEAILEEAELEIDLATEEAPDLETETIQATEEALGIQDEELDEDEEPADAQEILNAEEMVADQPITTDEGLVAPAEAELSPADDFDEFSGEADQPIKDELQRISETEEYKEYSRRLTEAQNVIDQFKAKREAIKDNGTIKIRRFKGGLMSEELGAIPNKFFTSAPTAPALDELANQWGVTMDEAIEILKSQAVTKGEIAKVAEAKREIAEIEAIMSQKNPQIGEAVKSITEKAPKLKLTQAQIIKRIYQAKAQGERAGHRAGRKQGQQEVKSAKEIVERRRNRVKGVADMLGLSDAEMKKINKRDIRLMSNYEFKQFIDNLEAMAANLADKRAVKSRIMFELEEKRLKGVKNLQIALKLPPIDKMTLAQLKQFEKALEGTEADDEFLSVRKLETVKNTELAGIKTVREAKEALAKKLGVPIEKLNNISIGPMDKLRFDAALADRNPFFRLLVDETNAVMIDAEQKFIEMEREVDDLVKKARDSRKKGLVDTLIPTDTLVFKWLETPDAQKAEVAKGMTDAELDLAHYLRERFAQFRDSLIKSEVLKKFKLDYITHVRRGFLEAWKADGVLSAFKEVFSQYQEDAETFKILEDDTQNILPLEKFFQFAMHRSGELKPSQNVSKAFKAYSKTILKKQALDRIIPALDIYAYSISPKAVTPHGLQMNRRLIQFTREWINNKKGRKSSLGGHIPQGGAVDIGLRTIDAFITLIDLGANIPVGLTVNVGEQGMEFIMLGSKKYALGVSRMNTVKGKEIISDHEAFVGKTPLRHLLIDTADSLGDKFHKAMFLLFESSTVRANKVHLLGSLTNEEWESGKVDPKRLADLKREMGRWRAVSGAKSIAGSTSAGSALTKYKSWAIPIVRTLPRDLKLVAEQIKKEGWEKASKSREFQELFRASLMSAFFYLAGRMYLGDDEDKKKDKTFWGELMRKAHRESLSVMGAIDPTVLSSVRLASFLGDLAEGITLLGSKYKRKSGDKGVEKLKRTLTPKVARGLLGDGEQKSGRKLK